MIAGLLPEIAAGLDVGVAQAGLLITAFAVGRNVHTTNANPGKSRRGRADRSRDIPCE